MAIDGERSALQVAVKQQTFSAVAKLDVAVAETAKPVHDAAAARASDFRRGQTPSPGHARALAVIERWPGNEPS